MERSNCATRAVVAVTSVQPTSEKRTVWQLTASRAALAGGATAACAPARGGSIKATASVKPATRAALRAAALSLTARPRESHDWHGDKHFEWAFNEFGFSLTFIT